MYKIIDIPFVKKQKNNLIKDAIIAHKRFNFIYNNLNNHNSTNYYRYYNFINLTFGSTCYLELFKILKKHIFNFTKSNEMWMQCWLNYSEKKEEVLNWHNHPECSFHGYLSIDPQNTETHFEKFKIKNKTGRLYVGSPNLFHKVVVKNLFKKPRITIAFDIVLKKDIDNIYKKYGQININSSFMPLIK